MNMDVKWKIVVDVEYVFDRLSRTQDKESSERIGTKSSYFWKKKDFSQLMN